MQTSYRINSVKTMLHHEQMFIHRLRIIGSVLIFVWGWYMCLSFRTTQFGEDGRSLQWYFVCSLVWIFLPSIIVFLSTDLSKTLRRALALTAITLLAVVIWANVEESVIVNRLSAACDQPGTAECTDSGWVIFERAWPFQNHTLSYHADYGWQAND